MSRTDTTKLLYAAEASPIVKSLLGLEPALRAEVIPSFHDMLASTPKYYLYEKEFDQAVNEPLLVLHSSGSTGTIHT